MVQVEYNFYATKTFFDKNSKIHGYCRSAEMDLQCLSGRNVSVDLKSDVLWCLCTVYPLELGEVMA